MRPAHAGIKSSPSSAAPSLLGVGRLHAGVRTAWQKPLRDFTVGTLTATVPNSGNSTKQHLLLDCQALTRAGSSEALSLPLFERDSRWAYWTVDSPRRSCPPPPDTFAQPICQCGASTWAADSSQARCLLLPSVGAGTAANWLGPSLVDDTALGWRIICWA
jgi:hypothetical protein